MNNRLFSGASIVLIGFLGAIFGGKYSTETEKQITSKTVFEEAYSEIFLLIENDFYNKKLTGKRIADLGLEINEILEEADGYHYPSLKRYVQWMFDPEYTQNLQELWHSFCWTLDRQYEKVCSDIGLPARSRCYRINERQYPGVMHFFKIYFFSRYTWADILLIAFLVLLITLFKITN